MSDSPYRYNENKQERTPHNSSQEAMLIQDGYCSPERPSCKGSSRQTPKSILKEYTNSGSKIKKGIIINETLNETRKLSLKSETSEAPIGKILRTDQSGRTQNLRPQNAGIMSFQAHITGSNQKRLENDDSKLNSKRELGSNWTSQVFDNTRITTNSNQELSEFQKVYLRNQQRQREQEIYSEMIRRSHESQEKDENTQNKAAIKSTLYQENKHLLRNFGQKRQSFDNQDSKRSLQSLSSIGYVEEKIQQLEKCLDVYSNRLRDSIIRQRDQLLASHYRKTENIEGNYESIKSWEGKESLSKNQENRNEHTLKEKNIYNNEESQENIYSSNVKIHSNRHSKELEHELNQLKQQNTYLKSQLPQAENSSKSHSYYCEKTLSGAILDKEIELLKTVDQIRAKLYSSVSKRTVYDKNLQSNQANILFKSDSKKTKTKKAATNAMIKKTNTDVPLRYQKVREAYGEAALERENARILNQGLSTTYNGFHWNADQSLKITRNV